MSEYRRNVAGRLEPVTSLTAADRDYERDENGRFGPGGGGGENKQLQIEEQRANSAAQLIASKPAGEARYMGHGTTIISRGDGSLDLHDSLSSKIVDNVRETSDGWVMSSGGTHASIMDAIRNVRHGRGA